MQPVVVLGDPAPCELEAAQLGDDDELVRGQTAREGGAKGLFVGVAHGLGTALVELGWCWAVDDIGCCSEEGVFGCLGGVRLVRGRGL